jgi:hypothetical protein
VFVQSGKEWNFRPSKADADFKAHLRSGDIPEYVARYAKKNIAAEEVKSMRELLGQL